MIKGIIRKGEYYDSVTMMLIAKEINKIEGVIDSTVVMGTKENISIIKNAGMLPANIERADDTDLLVVVNAENEAVADVAIQEVFLLLKKKRAGNTQADINSPKSFESALTQLPDATLSLISVAGKYAAREAQKAIDKNLHVMLFSDNVSIEDELHLKTYAAEKGLFVMGPDCGTAIIQGIPLAFANVVQKGNIGLVGASGTGIQEISSIISMNGGGISQAIGTGGRDVKKEIGGIMFIKALKELAEDESTSVLCLVSKPPYEEVLMKISEVIKTVTKPVVAIFIGADKSCIEKSGAIPAGSLEEAALLSLALAQKTSLQDVYFRLSERSKQLHRIAEELAPKIRGKYLRGLFSGGTLCDEAQLILKNSIGYMYSNSPLHPEFLLDNVWKSKNHTILDLGDDIFTSGRPHPMIDFSLRSRRIVDEAKDIETAIILFDVVLGYGSNMHPAKELVPAIKEATTYSPDICFVCSITGTDKDPQQYKSVKSDLEEAGVMVMPSNAAASELCGYILRK